MIFTPTDKVKIHFTLKDNPSKVIYATKIEQQNDKIILIYNEDKEDRYVYLSDVDGSVFIDITKKTKGPAVQYQLKNIPCINYDKKDTPLSNLSDFFTTSELTSELTNEYVSGGARKMRKKRHSRKKLRKSTKKNIKSRLNKRSKSKQN